MKTLTPEAIFVAPFSRVITAPIAPHCDIDTAQPYHAIAPAALDHEVDQYFITLQKLATYQSSPTQPDWMTLDLTLEIQRLAQPAKPRIEDWVSDNLPGWHIEDWAMAEPNDEFEPIRRSVAIADSYPIGAIAHEPGPSITAIEQESGCGSDAIALRGGANQ